MFYITIYKKMRIQPLKNCSHANTKAYPQTINTNKTISTTDNYLRP